MLPPLSPPDPHCHYRSPRFYKQHPFERQIRLMTNSRKPQSEKLATGGGRGTTLSVLFTGFEPPRRVTLQVCAIRREASAPSRRAKPVRGGRGRMSYASEAANRRAQNVQRSRPSAKVEVPQIPPQAVLAPRAAHSAVTGPGDEHPPELDQLADLLSRHGEMSGSLQV
jgi:hypothetical protein